MPIHAHDIEGLSRREREKLMRRKEMLAAARTIFARKGYAATTLEDVAELAEFGKGTLYNYFPNKEALFSSVLEEIFLGFSTVFDATLGSDLDFEEKIRQVLEGSLRHAFTNPEGILLMMRESHHLRENNPLMQMQPQLIRQLADTIAAEQQRNPRMLRNDPRLLAAVLINLVMGQFMGRIHLRIETMQDSSRFRDMPCKGMVTEIFGSLKSDEVEEDVRRSTELIHTLYFHGIYSAQN